jgi:hypothetical protein
MISLPSMTLEQALHELDVVNHQQAILSINRDNLRRIQAKAQREASARDLELLAIELSGDFN